MLLFAAITAVATWPQIAEPAGIAPHRDSWFNMWRLAWIAHQLPRDPAHLFDANIYHPERGTLAYSDATLLQGVLGAPLAWAGVPVPYVHTILVLGSFVFAGWSAWLLVRTLTGSTAAGIGAGLVFAYAPYRFDHYMHLELLWTGFMPLVLLMVHKVAQRPSLRAGIGTGLAFAAQVLSCIYYGVFLGVVLVPLTVLVAWPAFRRQTRRTLACGGAAVATVVLLTSPYALQYWRARDIVGERSRGEALLYSAGPSHFLAATPDNVLYGRLTAAFGSDEKRLFPGALAVALALFALWPPFDRPRLAYATALLVALDLSFGPRGAIYEALREHVPLFRGLRAPARAGALVLMFVAALAGFGLARLEHLLQKRTRPFAAAWMTAALVLMAAEYAVRPRSLLTAPVAPPPLYAWLAQQPHGPVVELPVPRGHELPLHDDQFTYNSTFHWRPIVNGYSGNVPASYMETMRTLHPFPTDVGVRRLRTLGVRYVVVHLRLLEQMAAGRMLGALDARRDLRQLRRFGGAAPAVVYEIQPADD